MISPFNPLGTPGFFDQAVMPSVPGILPGVLGPAPMPTGAMSPKLQEDYMKKVIGDFMTSMQSVQNSFAMYLGAPPAGAAAPTAAAPKK